MHSRHPTNLADERQFSKEEGDQIHPDCFVNLICNYRKHLVEVIATNLGLKPIECKGVLTYALLSCECLHLMANENMKTCKCLG